MIPFLCLLFAFSGAAGLLVESIWERYLGLFVGHGAYAQVLVLVLFLGGMSLGAAWTGRYCSRIRRPIRAWAIAEALAGLAALAFHPVFDAVTAFCWDRLFPALPAGPVLTAAKWGIAGALILPQSVLLGTTFPLMAAGAARLAGRGNAPGRLLALLYFANSLGASLGVLVAGFSLTEQLGLPGTLAAAAILELAVAAAALLYAGPREERAPLPEPPPDGGPAAPAAEPLSPPLVRLLLAVAFGTALASFVYEISWIRMLTLVLGGATHSFELMLSAFILGLAIGAFAIRRRADDDPDPLRRLGLIQVAMGIASVATLPLYLASFGSTAWLLGALARTDGGYTAFTAARWGICLAVMLPATICAGMTLPLLTRILWRGGAGERAAGTVYAVNTLGSIAGAALAGLVLMPTIGLKPMLVSGALLDGLLGVALLAVAAKGRGGRPLPAALAPAAVLFGAVALAAILSPFDRGVLASGVYRYGVVPPRGSREVLFHADGRTSTVAVTRQAHSGIVALVTNGKPDASLGPSWLAPPAGGIRPPMAGDESTQALMPVLALAHRPGAKRVAVIGHGSGMSSHVFLGDPSLAEVVTAEIEPRMIEGSRFFLPANRRVFEDPRSRLVIDDARSVLAADRGRFDVILSEPSNPWVSGVSGLFTEEFYSRLSKHLSDGGVLGQWLHLYEIGDPLVLSVLSALERTFADWRMYLVGGGDLLVIASNRPLLPLDPSVLARPGIAADLARFTEVTAADLEALAVAGRGILSPLVAAEPPNSDWFPRLDLGAERDRFLGRRADGLRDLPAGPFDLPAALEGRRRGFSERSDPSIPEVPLVRALSRSARLRLARAGRLVPAAADRDLVAALYGSRLFEEQLASDRPPVEWRLWCSHLATVARDLHDGTAGVADREFFAAARRYVGRTGGPPEAAAAVDLLEGLAAWEWDRVLAAGRVLLPGAARGAEFVPPALLRDGLVAAARRTGRVAEGRRAVELLSPLLAGKEPELRGRWIATLVADAPPR